MTSEGLFEGDSADRGADKFPLMLMGGRAEGLECANHVARTPIMNEISLYFLSKATYSKNVLSLSVKLSSFLAI